MGNIVELICLAISIMYFFAGDPQMAAIYNVGSFILLTRSR